MPEDENVNAYDTPEMQAVLKEAEEAIGNTKALFDDVGYEAGLAASYRKSGRMAAEQQKEADAEMKAFEDELERDLAQAAPTTSSPASRVAANKMRV